MKRRQNPGVPEHRALRDGGNDKPARMRKATTTTANRRALLFGRFHQPRQAEPKDIGAVEAGQREEAQSRQQQKNPGEPDRREGIDRELAGAVEIAPAAERRRREVDEQRRAAGPWRRPAHSRRSRRTSRRTSGARSMPAPGTTTPMTQAPTKPASCRDQCQQRDVAAQQKSRIAAFLLDARPFGERIDQDRLGAPRRVHAAQTLRRARAARSMRRLFRRSSWSAHWCCRT